MARQSWQWWIGGAAGMAALGALFAPPAPAPASLVTATRDDWKLQALPRRPDETTLAALVNSAAYWGVEDKPKPATAPAPDRRWRIAGIFGSGTSARVMIQYMDPSRPVQYLKVGDLLPGGHRITHIGVNDVGVSEGDSGRRLGVERRANP